MLNVPPLSDENVTDALAIGEPLAVIRADIRVLAPLLMLCGVAVSVTCKDT